LVVEEFFESFGADGRLEVFEVEVGEVSGELVEDAFVVAIRRFGEASPFRPKVVAGA